MTRSSRVVGLALLFMILLVLNYTARPVLAWRAGIDFLVIAVLLVAVRVRPGYAALVGFVAGIASDALSPAAFGAGATSLTLVAFGASWLKGLFFTEQLSLNGFFIFAGKLTFDALFLIVEQRVGFRELVVQLGVWSSLSAAVTAIAGLAVLVIFRPFVDMSAARA
jgi:rod shape-determining protein MreD